MPERPVRSVSYVTSAEGIDNLVNRLKEMLLSNPQKYSSDKINTAQININRWNNEWKKNKDLVHARDELERTADLLEEGSRFEIYGRAQAPRPPPERGRVSPGGGQVNTGAGRPRGARKRMTDDEIISGIKKLSQIALKTSDFETVNKLEKILNNTDSNANQKFNETEKVMKEVKKRKEALRSGATAPQTQTGSQETPKVTIQHVEKALDNLMKDALEGRLSEGTAREVTEINARFQRGVTEGDARAALDANNALRRLYSRPQEAPATTAEREATIIENIRGIKKAIKIMQEAGVDTHELESIRDIIHDFKATRRAQPITRERTPAEVKKKQDIDEIKNTISVLNSIGKTDEAKVFSDTLTEVEAGRMTPDALKNKLKLETELGDRMRERVTKTETKLREKLGRPPLAAQPAAGQGPQEVASAQDILTKLYEIGAQYPQTRGALDDIGLRFNRNHNINEAKKGIENIESAIQKKASNKKTKRNEIRDYVKTKFSKDFWSLAPAEQEIVASARSPQEAATLMRSLGKKGVRKRTQWWHIRKRSIGGREIFNKETRAREQAREIKKEIPVHDDILRSTRLPEETLNAELETLRRRARLNAIREAAESAEGPAEQRLQTILNKMSHGKWGPKKAVLELEKIGYSNRVNAIYKQKVLEGIQNIVIPAQQRAELQRGVEQARRAVDQIVATQGYPQIGGPIPPTGMPMRLPPVTGRGSPPSVPRGTNPPLGHPTRPGAGRSPAGQPPQMQHMPPLSPAHPPGAPPFVSGQRPPPSVPLSADTGGAGGTGAPWERRKSRVVKGWKAVKPQKGWKTIVPPKKPVGSLRARRRQGR